MVQVDVHSNVSYLLHFLHLFFFLLLHRDASSSRWNMHSVPWKIQFNRDNSDFGWMCGQWSWKNKLRIELKTPTIYVHVQSVRLENIRILFFFFAQANK